MRQRIALKIQGGPPDKYRWGLRKKYYRLTSNQKAWVAKRKLEKARRRLKALQKEAAAIEFKWCGLCRQAFIFCPECNNNTCNGGSECGLCYAYEELAVAARNGIWPTREAFPDADKIEKETEDAMSKFWGEESDGEST